MERERVVASFLKLSSVRAALHSRNPFPTRSKVASESLSNAVRTTPCGLSPSLVSSPTFRCRETNSSDVDDEVFGSVPTLQGSLWAACTSGELETRRQ